MNSLSDVAKEVARELGRVDRAVPHEYIINNTSVGSVKESKAALRELIEHELIATTPGFDYRLAHNSEAEEFRE